MVLILLRRRWRHRWATVGTSAVAIADDQRSGRLMHRRTPPQRGRRPGPGRRPPGPRHRRHGRRRRRRSAPPSSRHFFLGTGRPGVSEMTCKRIPIIAILQSFHHWQNHFQTDFWKFPSDWDDAGRRSASSAGRRSRRSVPGLSSPECKLDPAWRPDPDPSYHL